MSILSIENGALLLDGQPFYLASGDFHYYRTLPGGWRRRLRLMKAFGLNAVQTYVPWNLHEPEKGTFCFEGHLNLHAFLQVCQEEGLYVMLRPAPYICSECDFGGLPYWLMREPDTCVRTCDERYLKHVREYNQRLAQEFVPMLSTHGGPVLAVALENEYGSYGNDLEYLRILEKQYRELGIDVLLYTAGGPDLYKQTFGGFPEIWSGIDLGNNATGAIADWRKFQQDFPPYVSELWPGRAQQWGGVFFRQLPETAAENYREALHNQAYVNFYMFCGGSNFGFFSGANYSIFRKDAPAAKKRYIPFATSYDVDALVSEAGNATEKYRLCRNVLAAYRGIAPEDLPPIPEDAPTQVPDSINWECSCRMYDHLDQLVTKSVSSGNFRTMESMGQAYGWILYTTRFRRTNPETTFLLHLHNLHDRADIYIDGIYKGTYYRDRPYTPVEFTVTAPEARIDILVENLGRIGYGAEMIRDQKGILDYAQVDVRYPDGTLMYNEALITNWENQSLPMTADLTDRVLTAASQMESVGNPEPRLFRGHFQAKPGVDTFLNFRVPGAGKGCVWINGFHLGRYWAIGPQDTLYIPGELLQEENTLDVFELYSDGTAPQMYFQDHPELDSLQENAELVLRSDT